MLYEQEQVIQAFKIYSTLAINGKAFKEDLRLYLADDSIRGLVDQFAKEVDCTLLLVGDLIYMIPLSINSPYHISNETIKEKHLPSRAVNADIYMMYVAIIILFGEFYDSYQTTEATRDFIKMEDWLNRENDKILSLKGYDEKELMELERKYEYNWLAIVDKWDALDDIKENVQQTARTISRMSFMNIVKRFLEKQELIEGIGNNEIQLTEKAKAIIQRYYMELEYNREILEFIYSLEEKEGDVIASHITIEWILNDRPRRYGLTAVTLFLGPEGLKSLRYVYDYSGGDAHSIENIPFVKKNQEGNNRPASRQEIQEYYQYMQSHKMNAHTFDTIKDFHQYIEENFHIIPSEWKSIAHINGAEGDVEKFFEHCKTTSQLVDQLLIPVVEGALVGNGTKDFIQIFERQREHFKKHRELRRRIEESKNIEQKIAHYVSTYTRLHEAEEKMLNKKREAKSIYEFLVEEEDKTQKEISHVEELKELLSKGKQELRRKEASYELALLDKELKNARDDYEIIAEEHREIVSRLEGKEEELQNLEIAELKENIKKNEEFSNILKEQLEELDEDEDIGVLKDRLEENSSILKGYFEREKENLEKQKELLESQKNRYEDELQKIHEKIVGLQKEKQSLIEIRARYRGEIKGIEDNMENIRKDILANPINEMVEGEYPKWRQGLEKILPSLRKKEKFYEKKANRYELRLESFHKEFYDIIYFTQPLPSVKK